MTLPYDMGNAGDLLKHGVLAEFVRWQCELGRSFRFFDLFGGEPEGPAAREVVKRVRALRNGALQTAQSGVGEGLYYGSGVVARNVAADAGCGGVQVLTADRERGCRERLRASGLSMLDEGFPHLGGGSVGYDAYTAFGEIARILKADDLVLLDPFGEFLPRKAQTVVPQMAEAARHAAVLLFALNLDPGNPVGRRFDALLRRYLPGAWRMSCPPLAGTRVKGEATYHADVVLAARPLHEAGRGDVHVLRTRLTGFTRHLCSVLDLPAGRLEPRVVGG